MARLKQRLIEATNALASLQELANLTEPPTAIQRDAAIIRFTFTFEAVWKCARQYLTDIEGIEIASPKGVVRSSRSVGLLDEASATQAMIMADDRNLIVHTYKERLANELFARVSDHAATLAVWIDAMRHFADDQS